MFKLTGTSIYRKKTTLRLRLDALKYLDEEANGNKSLTARKFGVDRRTIRYWRRQKDKLEQTREDKTVKIRNRRQTLKERKPRYPEVDQKVLEVLKTERKKKLTMEGDDLKMEAIKSFQELEEKQGTSARDVFKASDSWLKGFKARNNVLYKSVTSTGQKIPSDAKKIALEFFEQIDSIRGNCSGNFIVWNMDQTPCYFDSPKNRTFDFSGNNTVGVRTTGNEKTRFTLMLCADNQGRKLEPTIIFKGIKNVPKGCPKGIKIMTGMKKFR